MRRLLHASVLVLSFSVASGCAGLLVGAGAGYLISTKVLPNDVHVSTFALDIDKVWPSVKETMSFYQDPGTELSVQDFPRVITAKVDGASVIVEVEALDIDQTTVRVQAEKYLSKDNATATEVMEAITERVQKL
jgi:hypothetical protein